MDTCLHGIYLCDDYACMRKLSGGVISLGFCFSWDVCLHGVFVLPFGHCTKSVQSGIACFIVSL